MFTIKVNSGPSISATSAEHSRVAHRLMLRCSGLLGPWLFVSGIFLAAEIDHEPVYCAGNKDGRVVSRQLAVDRMLMEEGTT